MHPIDEKDNQEVRQKKDFFPNSNLSTERSRKKLNRAKGDGLDFYLNYYGFSETLHEGFIES